MHSAGSAAAPMKQKRKRTILFHPQEAAMFPSVARCWLIAAAVCLASILAVHVARA
jgi:hypothetical protein